MNAEEWRGANEPSCLWRAVAATAPFRRSLLFCVACARRTLTPELPEEIGHLLNLLEASAEVPTDRYAFGELRLKIAERRELMQAETHRRAAMAAINAAAPELGSGLTVNYCFHEAAASRPDPEAEYAVQAATLRDIFGNPFHKMRFNESWRTDTAITLARQMYESRDFGAMPILADALQDAGCDNEDVLSHCRDTAQVHVRGCWVTDLVLDKR